MDFRFARNPVLRANSEFVWLSASCLDFYTGALVAALVYGGPKLRMIIRLHLIVRKICIIDGLVHHLYEQSS